MERSDIMNGIRNDLVSMLVSASICILGMILAS